jgi:hypothetical protein
MNRSMRRLVVPLAAAIFFIATGCSKTDSQSKADLKVPDIPAKSKSDGRSAPGKGK